MTSFGSAIAVDPQGSGTYSAQLGENWAINERPHGGYLLALLGNAAKTELGSSAQHTDILSASGYYSRAPEIGPVEVHAEVLRVGKSGSQVSAVLKQDGELRVSALFHLGTLDPATDPHWSDVAAPPLPPIEECMELPADPPGMKVSLMHELRIAMDPDTLGWALGEPTGRGEMRAWVEFRDEQEMDSLGLALVVDALPPGSFDLGVLGWVPTYSLTSYYRAHPAPGPLQVRLRTRHIQDNLLDEVCNVWDVNGKLVAQASQLAGFRP